MRARARLCGTGREGKLADPRRRRQHLHAAGEPEGRRRGWGGVGPARKSGGRAAVFTRSPAGSPTTAAGAPCSSFPRLRRSGAGCAGEPGSPQPPRGVHDALPAGSAPAPGSRCVVCVRAHLRTPEFVAPQPPPVHAPGRNRQTGTWSRPACSGADVPFVSSRVVLNSGRQGLSHTCSRPGPAFTGMTNGDPHSRLFLGKCALAHVALPETPPRISICSQLRGSPPFPD